MKPYFAICVLALIFASISCRKNMSVRSVDFMYLEQIVDKKPDSVYEQLKSIPTGRLSEGDLAWYILLRTEAEDKLYIPHTTDSLILQAKAYYEKANDVQRLAKAHYLAGRVYVNLEAWKQATNELLEARKLAAKEADLSLKGRIEESLGYINWKNRLKEKGLDYYKNAYSYYIETDDSLDIAYALKGIGNIYWSLGEKDSSFAVLNEALSVALHTNDLKLIGELYRRISFLYKEQQQYEEAYRYIRLAIDNTDENPEYYYIDIGSLFLHMEQLDSAYIYMQRVLLSEKSDLVDICLANGYLAEWAEKSGKKDEAYAYKKQYELFSDSIYAKEQVENVIEIQHQYDKNELKDNYKQVHIDYFIVVAILSLFGAAIIISLITRISKKNKKITDADSKLGYLLEIVRKNKEEIASLKERIKLTTSQNEALQKLEEENREILNRIRAINITHCKEHIRLKKLYDKTSKCMPFTTMSWYKFQTDFDTIFIDFEQRLKKAHPTMSESQIQICLLSIMGVKTEQIANLLGFQASTISTYKQKIKKQYFITESKAPLEEYLMKYII